MRVFYKQPSGFSTKAEFLCALLSELQSDELCSPFLCLHLCCRVFGYFWDGTAAAFFGHGCGIHLGWDRCMAAWIHVSGEEQN